MIFDGILLLSDIDGTLATYDRTIVPENRKAIEYFTKNGGRFGVATGRTALSSKQMTADITVNAPCIVVNGGGIYDFKTDEILFACYLDHSAVRLFQPVINAVPGVGIEINNNGILQCIQYSERSEKHVSYEVGSFTQYTLQDIPQTGNWFKALFTGSSDEIDQVEALCNQLVTEDDPFYVIRTEPTLFEILPKGATKGESLHRLANILSLPISQVYAIGDYYNDVDFLSAAGFSAAVKGAPEEVLAVTDYTTCSCEEGAVADFINFIERRIQNSSRR